MNLNPARRRHVRLIALAAAPLLAASLAACGGSSGSDKSGGGDQKSFTYWSMWQEKEPQAKVIAGAISQFTKDTGIKVKVEWQGRAVLDKVTPLLRGGDVPDLVDQGDHGIKSTLADNDAAADLSSVYSTKIPGESVTVSDSGVGKYRDTVTDKGKPYLVPYEVLSYGFFFNGATLPAVASKAPTTWTEFMALLNAQKAAGKKPLAVDGDIGGYDSFYPSQALIAALGPGGFHKLAGDKTGKAWMDSAVLDALKQVEDVAKGGYFVDGSFGSKFPAVQEKWAGNKADFLLMGSWCPSETAPSAASGFKYRSFQYPGFAEKGLATAETIGFGVPEPAKNKDAAKKFIAYMMTKENLGKIASVALNLVPRPDVTVPAQLNDMAKSLAAAKTFVPLQDNVDSDYGTYADQVYYPLTTELLSGKLTASQFADKIAAKQANYWKSNG